MKDFMFYNPTRIIFGKTAIKKIRENVRAYGKKVLLTFGRGSIKKNGIYDKVMEQLEDFEVKEFGGIEPNPRIETLRGCLSQHKGFKPDLILAVGGGSTIDGSKLLSASWHYHGDPWDFLKSDAESPLYVPLATVLTISATGSEMNKGAVITNWETHEKLFFQRESLYPRFSILDPRNTFSVPKDQTAYGGADSFSHVLEQYINTTLDAPLQDKFAEGILKTIIENEPIALQDPHDYNARANLMLCATMAMNYLIGSGVGQDWAAHGIENELSGFYDIPHGAGLAILTPRWMEVVKDQKEYKILQYGRQVWGFKKPDVDMVIERTYEFFKELEIRMSLKEWDIDDMYFDQIVERLVKIGIGEIRLTKKQIRTILQKSLTLY